MSEHPPIPNEATERAYAHIMAKLKDPDCMDAIYDAVYTAYLTGRSEYEGFTFTVEWKPRNDG